MHLYTHKRSEIDIYAGTRACSCICLPACFLRPRGRLAVRARPTSLPRQQARPRPMTESNAQHDQAIESLQACCLRLLKPVQVALQERPHMEPCMEPMHGTLGSAALSPAFDAERYLHTLFGVGRRKGAPDSWPSYAQCRACATAGSALGRTQVTHLTPVACSQQLKRCNFARLYHVLDGICVCALPHLDTCTLQVWGPTRRQTSRVGAVRASRSTSRTRMTSSAAAGSWSCR